MPWPADSQGKYGENVLIHYVSRQGDILANLPKNLGETCLNTVAP
jgi:hypothetical protein